MDAQRNVTAAFSPALLSVSSVLVFMLHFSEGEDTDSVRKKKTEAETSGTLGH